MRWQAWSARLNRSAAEPLSRQIEQRLRMAITAGELERGARLPSTRSFAAQLGVARGTVENAIETLKAEGLLLSHRTTGTFVSTEASLVGAPSPRAPFVERDSAPFPALEWPFRVGAPAFDKFPRKLWVRLAVQQARRTMTPHGVRDSKGVFALRSAVAAYIGLTRGVRAPPENVFITAGYRGALGLIAATFLEVGSEAWVEDPGYYPARDALHAARARLVPVPVDAEGMQVEKGTAAAPRARLAIVTPAHQSPLGTTLSLRRRLELLEWARRAKAWIVEDDYDGEFRYTSSPLSSLQSLDRWGRVLYAGTFSKTISPYLRLGYLIAPPEAAERLSQTVELIHPTTGVLDQMIVAHFISEGHHARHVRRMRLLYAKRRIAVADALAERFGDKLKPGFAHGGMHIMGWLPEGVDDARVASAAHTQSLGPQALSQFRLAPGGPPALLLGFTNIDVGIALRAADSLFKSISRLL